MSETSSSTTHARFVPTRETIAATHVTGDNKTGPWECPSETCRLPLTHVKGTQAAGRGASIIERGPFFKRKAKRTVHSPDCTVHLNDAAKMSRYTPRTGYAPRNETVLLRVGFRPDNRKEGAESSNQQTRNSGPDYAGRPGSMLGILKLMDDLGGEDAMSKLWHTHHGVRYRWDEIAYGPEHSEYERLHGAVSSLFSHDPHRPWIIWGTIQAAAKTASSDTSSEFLRVAANYTATIPKVRVFIPDTPEFEDVIARSAEETQIAFVLSKVKETDKAMGIYGYLNSPSDIAFLS